MKFISEISMLVKYLSLFNYCEIMFDCERCMKNRHYDKVISIDIPLFNTPWGGLRVEDGYWITADGAERLNETPYWIEK
jgi:hypothetical protein